MFVFFLLLQVNHLQLIGGDTIKECVKRYMGEVLHHQLALTYNWAGKAGWKGDAGVVKRAFCGLKICAAVKRTYTFSHETLSTHGLKAIN